MQARALVALRHIGQAVGGFDAEFLEDLHEWDDQADYGLCDVPRAADNQAFSQPNGSL